MMTTHSLPEIECKGCGVSFTPHDKRQTFHSRDCRSAYNNRMSYRRHAAERIEQATEYRKAKKLPAMAEQE